MDFFTVEKKPGYLSKKPLLGMSFVYVYVTPDRLFSNESSAIRLVPKNLRSQKQDTYSWLTDQRTLQNSLGKKKFQPFERNRLKGNQNFTKNEIYRGNHDPTSNFLCYLPIRIFWQQIRRVICTHALFPYQWQSLPKSKRRYTFFIRFVSE